MQRQGRISTFITVCVGAMVLWPLMLFSAGNIELQFNGELLERPCTVAANSVVQDVNFPLASYRDFWVSPGRTPAESFSINLVNCYPAIFGKVVKVIFQGTSEPELPGYIAVQGSNAGLLAIGILDMDGSSLLPLNSASSQGAGVEINNQQLVLPFKAFVQAIPGAIQSKSVVPGEYSATAQFLLNYE